MYPIMMIPAYNPDEKLLTAIDDMLSAGFERILIVDDGSRSECAPIFAAAEQKPGCVLIHHAVNLGKGRALKTGFNEVLLRWPDASGVITADADGQHRADAALRVARAMERHPSALVLGVRQFFKGKNVPLPNLLGNTITRGAFWLLTGLGYGDTQCGLRGFTPPVMRRLIAVAGERFEYENIMLLAMRSFGLDIVEVPMEAVYIGNNESSHFKPGIDSVRIYRRLIQYALGPILAGLLAFVLFRELRGSLSLWDGTLACGLGTLVGWILMSLALGKKKGLGLAAGLGITVLHAGLYWLLHVQAGIAPTGAWWLAAIPAAVFGYIDWLNLRCGRRPKLIHEDDEE